MKALVGHVGGRVGDGQKAAVHFGDLASRMEQLSEEHRAEAMHGLREVAIALDRGISVAISTWFV